MYGFVAAVRRSCTGTRRDGEPCRAWAMWDPSAEGRCVIHAGRGHHGQQCVWNEQLQHYMPRWFGRDYHARYTPCTCAAYAWPHRPGGGLCRWPNAPAKTCPTPANTRNTYGKRRY
jgi:hypothetical protein